MVWNAIDFVCREAALQLRRERLIAIATSSTVAVLLLVLGGMILFMLDVRLWTRGLAEEAVVSAYFKSEVPRERVQEIADEIAAWGQVRAVRFVPKEEGWEWLQQNLASSAKLRGLENPLPDAVHAYVAKPDLMPEVAAELEALEGVQDVVPSAEAAGQRDSFAHRLVQARRAVSWGGVAIAALVVLAGVFIVHNTVRLALHSRWREIFIMQLIGVTRPIVAAPFLLEGAIHGAVGAALACCILVPVHLYLRSLCETAAPFIVLLPDAAMLPFAVGLTVAGAALGVTGAAISVRRFLSHKPEWHR